MFVGGTNVAKLNGNALLPWGRAEGVTCRTFSTPCPIFYWGCILIGNGVNLASTDTRTSKKFTLRLSILNVTISEYEKGSPYYSLPLLSAFQVQQMVVHIDIGLSLPLW